MASKQQKVPKQVVYADQCLMVWSRIYQIWRLGQKASFGWEYQLVDFCVAVTWQSTNWKSQRKLQNWAERLGRSNSIHDGCDALWDSSISKEHWEKKISFGGEKSQSDEINWGPLLSTCALGKQNGKARDTGKDGIMEHNGGGRQC